MSNLYSGISWRLRPTITRAIAKVRQKPLTAAASVTEIWAEGSSRVQAAAIALPNELSRVVCYASGLDPQDVAKKLSGRDVYDPPTYGSRFDDAVIADGCLYTSYAYDVLARGARSPFIRGCPAEMNDAMLCTSAVINRYFGDWLMSGLALEKLAEERNLPPLSVPNASWAHERPYRARAGLPDPLSWPSSTPVRIGSLWVVDDRGMNRSRIERFASLRTRVASQASSASRRVYVDRGNQAVDRGHANADATRRHVESLGFEIVFPEDLSVDQLAEKLSDCAICVGVEGSNLTHATMLMPSGSGILALQPPRHFQDAIKIFADGVGQRFAYMIGDESGQEFTIDLGRLTETIHALEAELA